MNRLVYLITISIFNLNSFAQYRRLDVNNIGNKVLREASLGIIGVTAGAIAVLVILGNLGVIENPMQKIKEKSVLAFLGLVAPALVSLIAYFVR